MRGYTHVPKELPTLPTPRARGMVLLWNPNAELGDFIAVIESDPGLTAGIVRAANSAYSAPLEPVTSCRNAVVRIGLDAARQITAAAMVRAEFDRLEESGIDVTEMWRWLLAVGLLTEAFATHDQLGELQRQSAFTAGLLHQVGRLALASKMPALYDRVVDAVLNGKPVSEAEEEILGENSLDWTEAIAEAWHMPEPLLSAISGYGRPDPSPLAKLIAEAVEVAPLLGFSDGFDDRPDPVRIPEDHPRSDTIIAIGGHEGIATRVRWFRRATGPHDETEAAGANAA